ncbi:1,4-dihydroxy-2-naphthoyl-CoA hydrolase in phylloquinone biosynthesis [Pseudomonas chlororaphis subsp. aureofaciens]|uniref:1,4-dihydroxy-2-naphthoyl-CoA hydrolase in phylloquinone biosynthesis n=1 Tax=Pseudomonas chlororaphis subsp. aureofaciens TaxID=587851 RepID=A0AAD0ZJM0_9PSED|nr:thioesterase family protein [Pseudomonas chlororaphis]AZE17869.1 1,4-dihydroxy-2-naphthoyl-CoA hydrolase in phylloquinone biosynthesis [Pseudomonas chlororaphis subsp. aureofaciens]AZE30339.1 1,4-dihydroxy-2-naphthoyl-CoA hydrolase in phylloquinone biosynthesis [Pseudomonas chlororaphis subsp. aureofaciens]AZE36667.1 1,4-dihydroxy-2-naphthoyl-CoA hydrolase in phylloquinone biosynthesis [Pseudomonas chlororaphis subsp. aureofaciens]AZE42972.1 1,4-dihydroxy-2-naphthoyl-CoA hydrolase in phylloq
MSNDPALHDFAVRSSDKIRYADTDRQGHVNNAVFATFLETGRVEIIYDPHAPLAEPGSEFVIARLELDLRAELRWPGTVQIGTRVATLGNSSMTLEQALFQDGRCAALATTVIVQIDAQSRRSKPFGEEARRRLSALTTTADSFAVK